MMLKESRVLEFVMKYRCQNSINYSCFINTYKEKHKYGLLITHTLQELVNIVKGCIDMKVNTN